MAVRYNYTYITTNPGKTTFYTGVTNNLVRRLSEHKANRGQFKTFAGRYYCYNLAYYEHYTSIKIAIELEKEIKDLSHEKKLN